MRISLTLTNHVLLIHKLHLLPDRDGFVLGGILCVDLTPLPSPTAVREGSEEPSIEIVTAQKP